MPKGHLGHGDRSENSDRWKALRSGRPFLPRQLNDPHDSRRKWSHPCHKRSPDPAARWGHVQSSEAGFLPPTLEGQSQISRTRSVGWTLLWETVQAVVTAVGSEPRSVVRHFSSQVKWVRNNSLPRVLGASRRRTQPLGHRQSSSYSVLKRSHLHTVRKGQGRHAIIFPESVNERVGF